MPEVALLDLESPYTSHLFTPTTPTTLFDVWKRHGLPTYYECEDFFGLRYDKYHGEAFGMNALVKCYRYGPCEGSTVNIFATLKEVRS